MDFHLLQSAGTDSPEGTVFLTHGFGEHHRRYQPLIDDLHAAGFDVITGDLPNHGESGGKRGRVDVGRLISEHVTARRDALKVARTPDLLLFGHSMGGLITAASALIDSDHAKAMVLSGPALRPLPHVNPRLARAILPFARMFPGFPAAKLDASTVSRDPKVVEEYEADPLIHHGWVPLLTGVTMTIQGDQTIRNATLLRTPTLIMHGGDDQLADPAGSREFVERVGGVVDVDLRIIDDAYHEILNEPEGPRLRREIITWLESR